MGTVSYYIEKTPSSSRSLDSLALTIICPLFCDVYLFVHSPELPLSLQYRSRVTDTSTLHFDHFVGFL